MKEKARKRNVYELFSLCREGKNQDYCLNHHRLILDRRDTVVIFDLFLCGEPHISYNKIFGRGLVALRVHGRYIQILKSYIRQMVVFFVRLHIEICIALKPAVSDRSEPAVFQSAEFRRQGSRTPLPGILYTSYTPEATGHKTTDRSAYRPGNNYSSLSSLPFPCVITNTPILFLFQTPHTLARNTHPH